MTVIRKNWLLATSVLAGIGLFIAIFAVPVFAADDEIILSPSVISIEGLARDVFERELVVENISDSRLAFYPTVRNLTALGGVEPFIEMQTRPEENKARSLANWVELHRGRLVLDPGESETIKFRVEINSRAEFGTYHAIIAFPSGNTREKAEEKLDDVPHTVLTLRVGENIQESISLLSFTGVYALSSSDPVTLTYEFENGGNRALSPSGEILIYDRRGEQIDSLPINTEGLTIPPGESVLLASVWDSANQNTGRLKAFLNVDYGEANLKSIQDTAFFWVVPLPLLAAIFVFLLGGSLIVVAYIQRRALARHRVRVDDWHRESASVHGTGAGKKQKIQGLPDSPHRSDGGSSVFSNQKVAIEADKGNTVDLRGDERD